jgi:hypothetical protein
MAPLALALLVALGSTPSPYPIAPRPLRRLIEEAEFIVTARVREADAETAAELRAGDPWGGGSVVLLDIERRIQGDPGADTIAQINRGWICPAPAHYEPGTRVLAFLDRSDDGTFETHALSYGAKTLDEEGMAVYLDRIAEQLEIQRMPPGEERERAQIEWFVRCAEHPLTRWEGAYELAPRGDFMAHYDRDQPLQDPEHVSEAQKIRLRDALLSARVFDAGERCLEELLVDDPDPRVLTWLVDRLRDVHEEVERDGYGTSNWLVERIARRDPRRPVRDLAAKFESMREYGSAGDDGPGRLRAVKELLALY